MPAAESILVIDDEKFVRTAIRQILEEKGYQVLEAEDGATGIELAKKELPDLIICDIVMEGVDGFATLQELRHNPPTAAIPLIIMTGYQNPNSMRLAMSLGADDFLVKPFPLYELLASVEARLKQRKVVHQAARRELDQLRRSISVSLPPQLRAPLTGILTTARLLANRAHDLPREQIRDLAGLIETSAEELRRASENFIICAQLELVAGGETASAEPRSGHQPSTKRLVEDAAAGSCQRQNRQADLRLEVADGSATIEDQYLARIVEELVDNACEWSAPGTPVAVSTWMDSGLRLAVSDRGKGMTPEQIERLQAPLRLGRRLQEQPRFGLGLTVVRGLVELHGGHLELESEPEQGTTVTVVLPTRGAAAE